MERKFIKMINVLVSGANGRMGQEVISAISKDNGLDFICGFSNTNEKLRKYTCI